MKKNKSADSYEQIFVELENIVEKMDSGEISLEKSLELFEKGINSSDYQNLIVGILASFFVGYLSIEFLLRFLRLHGTLLFVIYRIVLGAGVLIFWV